MLPFGKQYWYIYAGPVMGGEVWATAVTGPALNAVPLAVTLTGDLKWVQSLDHRPSDAEVDAHTPAEFQDVP